MPTNHTENFSYEEFFKDTLEIFREQTTYMVLLEKYSDKVHIGPINELRGALYHLYNFVGKPNELKEQFIEAKEHVYRAYFDCFAMLAALLIERIQAFKTEFGIEIISAVFPDYFTRIKPEVQELILSIAKIRASRETVGTLQTNIEEIRKSDVIALLLQWHTKLESLTNDFQEYKNNLKAKDVAKTRKDWFLRILFLVFGTIITLLIKYFLPSH